MAQSVWHLSQSECGAKALVAYNVPSDVFHSHRGSMVWTSWEIQSIETIYDSMKITLFVSWVMLTVTDEIQIKERNHNIETVPRSAKTATNSTKWETFFFTGGRWLLLHGVSWKRNVVCRYKIFNCQWMTNLLYDNLEMFCSEIALCRPGGRKRSWCSVAESSGRMSCQLQFPLCCASSGLSELHEVRCESWNGDRQVTSFCDFDSKQTIGYSIQKSKSVFP